MMPAETLTILLATDGSNGSLGAAHWIVEHFDPARTRVIVLTVARLSNAAEYGITAPSFFEDFVASCQRGLDHTVQALEGFPVSAQLREGEPIGTILDAVAEFQPDLLVAGHRGLHGIASILSSGSVAQALVHRSPVPVLIVPKPAQRSAD